MSKKSQKNRRKKPRKPHSQSSAVESGATEAEHHGPLEIPDEILHAPKDTSKLRFALMIGLVVVLLIIFVVPQAITSMAGGGQGDPVAVSWRDPVHGEVQRKYSQFMLDKRAFSDALSIDPTLRILLGIEDRQISDPEAARLLVLDSLAQDAGIVVSDTDLGSHIRGVIDFFYQRSVDTYLARADQIPGGISYVESNLRRCLRIQRFLSILGYVGALPDPQEIERLWGLDHEEYAFDYIALPVSDMNEAARAELPEDAELAAWFEELPAAERDTFLTPERRDAELVVFRDAESTPGAELVARYPEPSEADPEERAQEYYNRVFHERFQRPPAEVDPDAPVPLPGARQVEFTPFEEAKEAALAEAPIYFAMQEWLTDLQARQAAGEEIDLAAETAAFGLEYQALDEPKTRAELVVAPGLGRTAADAIYLTPSDSFNYGTVLFGTEGIAIVRVTERLEPAMPAFEDLREEVSDLWIAPRAEELALERLTVLREGLETFEPPAEEERQLTATPPYETESHRRATPDELRAAAEAEGLVVATRDFLDKGGRVEEDPDSEDPAHRYIFLRRELYGLQPDEVSEADVDTFADEPVAYVVRLSGQRPVAIEAMSPGQYGSYKTRAESMAKVAVSRAIDVAFLQENYELWLSRDDQGDEEELDEELAE